MQVTCYCFRELVEHLWRREVESSETFKTFLIQRHASRFKEKRSRFVIEMNAWIHENLRQVEDSSGCHKDWFEELHFGWGIQEEFKRRINSCRGRAARNTHVEEHQRQFWGLKKTILDEGLLEGLKGWRQVQDESEKENLKKGRWSYLQK